MFEGVGLTLVSELKHSMLSTFKGKIGALLVKSSLKQVLKKYDASEYGGAPMIGLNGLVVKTIYDYRQITEQSKKGKVSHGI